jgi:hypothetical protein
VTDTTCPECRQNETVRAQLDAVKALLFRHYTGSPGFEKTPPDITELDAIADLYDAELAACLRAVLGGTK